MSRPQTIEERGRAVAAGMDPRLDAIRATSTRILESARPEDLHLQLPLYGLLSHAERRRLALLFPEELWHSPEGAQKDPVARILWDMRAQALLWRLVEFADLVAEEGLVPARRLAVQDGRGALVLTVHGSLLALGAPRPSGLRRYRYATIRPGQGVSGGRGDLLQRLSVGRPGRIGPLTFSRVQLLALDPLGRPELDRLLPDPSPPGPGRPALSKPSMITADRLPGLGTLRYDLRRQAVQGRREPVSPSLTRECDLVAEALLLQQAAGERGHDLIAVSAFVTRAGTRYDVLPRDSGAPDLLCTPASGPSFRLDHTCIDPLKVVRGAPLVIQAWDDTLGRSILARCTSVVESVELR